MTPTASPARVGRRGRRTVAPNGKPGHPCHCHAPLADSIPAASPSCTSHQPLTVELRIECGMSRSAETARASSAGSHRGLQGRRGPGPMRARVPSTAAATTQPQRLRTTARLPCKRRSSRQRLQEAALRAHVLGVRSRLLRRDRTVASSAPSSRSTRPCSEQRPSMFGIAVDPSTSGEVGNELARYRAGIMRRQGPRHASSMRR